MSDFADIINGIVYSELQCEPDFVLSFYWAKQITAKSVKKKTASLTKIKLDRLNSEGHVFIGFKLDIINHEIV